MEHGVKRSAWYTRFNRYILMFAWFVLGLFVLVAVLAPFLARDQPYYTKSGDDRTWNIFTSHLDKPTDLSLADKVILAPIPFRAQGYTKLSDRLKPPGTPDQGDKITRIHYLGTDRWGRDVAAGIVYGCRKSLWIGFLAMSVAALIGICLGASAGYWGNQLKIRIGWPLLVCMALAFYVIYLAWYAFIGSRAAFTIILILGVLQHLVATGTHVASKTVPLDLIVLKLIEIFHSIPALLMLLVIAAFIDTPTLATVAFLIAALRWTSFARFTRAEVMKIKARDYILAAKVSGLSSRRIIFSYILPETLGPLVVVFAFGVSSVVLLESTLSFLGIGIPLDEVTWGTLLAQSRQNTNAWWLAFFPGFCIMLLVFSLNLIGSNLKGKFDPQD